MAARRRRERCLSLLPSACYVDSCLALYEAYGPGSEYGGNVRPVFLPLALVLVTACNRSAVTGPTPSPSSPVPVVVPPGSYRLAGWVTDAAGRPIESVSVEILECEQAGSVKTNLADGSFIFGTGFSVAPTMRASKSGYIFVNTGSYISGNPPTIYKWFRLGSSTPPID